MMGKSFDVGYNEPRKTALEKYQETAAKIAPDISTKKKRRRVFENALKHRDADIMKLCLDQGHNPMWATWLFPEKPYHGKVIDQGYKSNFRKDLACLDVLANDQRTNFAAEYTVKEAIGFSEAKKGTAVTHVIYQMKNLGDKETENILITLFQNPTARVTKKDLKLFKNLKGKDSIQKWDDTEQLLTTRYKEGLGLGRGKRGLIINN